MANAAEHRVHQMVYPETGGWRRWPMGWQSWRQPDGVGLPAGLGLAEDPVQVRAHRCLAQPQRLGNVGNAIMPDGRQLPRPCNITTAERVAAPSGTARVPFFETRLLHRLANADVRNWPSRSLPKRGPMTVITPEADAVLAVVKAEHEAFWMRDYEAWARCHLQANDTWFWSYWPHGGLAVRQGWTEISERAGEAMSAFIAASPSYAFKTVWENVVVRVGGDSAWVTFIQRYPARGGPFPDGRGPGHLSHGLRILERHEGTWKIALFSVLVPFDQTSQTLLRLDPDGRIIWKSDGAEEALLADDDLVVRGGRLRVRSGAADRKLQAAIRWAASSDSHLMAFRGSIPIVMDGGEGMPVKLWWLIAESGVILFSFGNRTLAEDRLAIAATVFGLSSAQLRVATRIVQGHTLAEIAETTGVSINTVRTQLRRTFDKVGVHNQPALVRVLLSVAAPR